MKTRTDKSVSHQRGSANVYADLGYKSADEMLVKAQLVTTIAEILAERGYTQTKAAALLGIPQPKLSKMLRGQFRGFSERKLMDCLTLLGRDIDIVVRATSKRKGQGAPGFPYSAIRISSARLRHCSFSIILALYTSTVRGLIFSRAAISR